MLQRWWESFASAGCRIQISLDVSIYPFTPRSPPTSPGGHRVKQTKDFVSSLCLNITLMCSADWWQTTHEPQCLSLSPSLFSLCLSLDENRNKFTIKTPIVIKVGILAM